jgi:hypothetical protein
VSLPMSRSPTILGNVRAAREVGSGSRAGGVRTSLPMRGADIGRNGTDARFDGGPLRRRVGPLGKFLGADWGRCVQTL